MRRLPTTLVTIRERLRRSSTGKYWSERSLDSCVSVDYKMCKRSPSICAIATSLAGHWVPSIAMLSRQGAVTTRRVPEQCVRGGRRLGKLVRCHARPDRYGLRLAGSGWARHRAAPHSSPWRSQLVGCCLADHRPMFVRQWCPGRGQDEQLTRWQSARGYLMPRHVCWS